MVNRSMSAEAGSDEELFRLFLERREDDPFAELVRRHQTMAYRIAFGYCGQPELAEEIVQETFLRIAREPSTACLRGYPSFSAWFAGVTLNIARHVVRTERRTVNRSGKPAYLESKTQLERERQAGAQTDADADLHQALTKALGQLSEELRLPLVLQYMQGLSQAEIGTLTGVSQPMVSKRIQKGISALRAQLAQAGMVISAVSLPDLLGRAEFLNAHPSLPDAGIASLARRAAAQTPFSASQGAAALLLRAVAACCALAAATGTYFAWSSQASVPAISPPIAATSSTKVEPVAQAKQDRVYTWTFDQPTVAGEFEILLGSWRWLPAEGKRAAAMAADNTLFRLPIAPRQRPFRLTTNFSMLIKPGDNFNFGAYYYKGHERVAHKVWRKVGNVMLSPEFRVDYYFVDHWVLALLQGQPNYLSKYDEPWASSEIAVSSSKSLIRYIELRYLEPTDIPAELKQPEALIIKHGLTAGKNTGP